MKTSPHQGQGIAEARGVGALSGDDRGIGKFDVDGTCVCRIDKFIRREIERKCLFEAVHGFCLDDTRRYPPLRRRGVRHDLETAFARQAGLEPHQDRRYTIGGDRCDIAVATAGQFVFIAAQGRVVIAHPAMVAGGVGIDKAFSGIADVPAGDRYRESEWGAGVGVDARVGNDVQLRPADGVAHLPELRGRYPLSFRDEERRDASR